MLFQHFSIWRIICVGGRSRWRIRPVCQEENEEYVARYTGLLREFKVENQKSAPIKFIVGWLPLAQRRRDPRLVRACLLGRATPIRSIVSLLGCADPAKADPYRRATRVHSGHALLLSRQNLTRQTEADGLGG